MDTKNVQLSGSTRVETRLYPTLKKGSTLSKILRANQFLYGCQAGAKKDFEGFYLDFMREWKLFCVCGLNGC